MPWQMYGDSSWCIKHKLEQNLLCQLRECSREGAGDNIMPLEDGESEEAFLIRLLDGHLNKEVLNTDDILFVLNKAEWRLSRAEAPAPSEEGMTASPSMAPPNCVVTQTEEGLPLWLILLIIAMIVIMILLILLCLFCWMSRNVSKVSSWITL